MMQLQRKVKLEKFFGGVNRQVSKKEYAKLMEEDLTSVKDELNVEEVREEKR